MFDSLVSTLRDYPPLALFLTIGLGFMLGRVRFGRFSLGNVTSVLLVGLLVGQLGIAVSGPVKMFFFMLFLFSIGYSVGPDFFRSLRGSGLRQVLFAVVMSIVCFVTTLGIALLMGYGKGVTVGMFAGAQTCSSVIGVGGEAISRLGLAPDDLQTQMSLIPVCYAVTYIFGTLGTVIILGNFGPRLLGGLDKVKASARELEKQLNNAGGSNDPARVRALRGVVYRVYRVDNPWFATPRTVADFEHRLRREGLDVCVDHLMHDGEVTVPGYDDTVVNGDEVVVCGRRGSIVYAGAHIGPEVADAALLSYPLERVHVVVSRRGFIGEPLGRLQAGEWMRGLTVRDALRGGKAVAVDASTVFRKGDRLTVIGRAESVALASRHIGHVDRPSVSTDLMFVGLAIFIGGLFGTLCLWIGSVPLSFGMSGGALLAGLFFGWLRSKRPSYGHISPGALWIMNNLGLTVFIAVIGIEAAPQFVSGLVSVGPWLFAAGAVATSVPLFVGLWLGHKVFKFNPVITLGCCAGTRTCTASLGAVQDAVGSTLPAIGYAVTYAVANVLLVVWGLLAAVIA